MGYPLPNYHFIVQWGGENVGFTEVTGLDIIIDVIEYRSGSSPVQSVTKMPGLIKYSNIILKRGIVKGDTDFYKWINTIRQSTVERRDIVISLLNENHEPVMTWKARNSFPVKYSGPDLNAKSSEVAIETLELAHEGLTLIAG
ncbi:MAG TPA: phage tail protein [Ignavibacteria bacterium]|nr:phage tail protein [Ignavibacteria bacterium]